MFPANHPQPPTARSDQVVPSHPDRTGLQIAFTDANRIDEIVVVQGMTGRIEEITLTYVAVRVKDNTTPQSGCRSGTYPWCQLANEDALLHAFSPRSG